MEGDYLQMLTTEEVCEKLNISRNQLQMLREIGVIKGIKTGKAFMFSPFALRNFMRQYEGLDVSNPIKAREAYKLVNANGTNSGAC